MATSSSIATLLPQLSYPDGVGIVDASCRWDRAASSSLAENPVSATKEY